MTQSLAARLLCAAALLAGNSVAAQQSALAFVPFNYDIQIALPDSGAAIHGDVRIDLLRRARSDTLTLDLLKLRVARVELDHRQARFTRTDSTIVIDVPSTAPDTLHVRVIYDGAPSDGLIASRDSAGRWTYFGDNWPNRARYWIAGIDRPDAKASVSWTVTAPVSKTVVANGVQIENQVFGMGAQQRVRSRWRESKPIPLYLMVIAAAPLVKFDLGETACGHAEIAKCVAQSVYVAPEQRNVLPGSFAKAGDIVEFYARLMAPFPYEKLAHLQSRTRFGGMENASAIFYADAPFHRRGLQEGIIAHETAHQWFGDAVTEKSWPHLWLSEGFATYFAALYTQHAHGDSAFLSEMARLRGQILGDTVSVPKRPVIDTTETDLLALLNTNSYQKGAYVLHMLRSQLGDSAFFRGLREYYAAHKDGNALSDDLRAALEHSSGKDLRAFFDQWLRRPGYPEVAVTAEDDATGMVIVVKQHDRFGLFDFPLPILIRTNDGAQRTVTIPVKAVAVTRMSLGVRRAEVNWVSVDPRFTVLMRSLVTDVGAVPQPRR